MAKQKQTTEIDNALEVAQNEVVTAQVIAGDTVAQDESKESIDTQKIIDDAKAEATKILEDAKSEGIMIIEKAQEKAQEIIETANNEAQEIIEDAKVQKTEDAPEVKDSFEALIEKAKARNAERETQYDVEEVVSEEQE